MTQPYWFSFYAKTTTQRIVRRPWWKFWAHDTLVTEDTMRRRSIELDESEAVLRATRERITSRSNDLAHGLAKRDE